MQKQRRKHYKRPENYVPQSYKKTDLAYMAGIVDGEGCFFICKIPKKTSSGYVSEHFRGLLKIDNTDEVLINWLKTTFSGTCSAIGRHTSSKKYTRTVYSWVATGDRLLDLCELLLPFLVIKKKHCEVMIKFRKTYVKKPGSNKLDPKQISVREECLKSSRKLNSRWHLHPLKN